MGHPSFIRPLKRFELEHQFKSKLQSPGIAREGLTRISKDR